MTQWDEGSVAAELLACEAERRDREPFTDEWPDLDVDTGYRIQDANLQSRLARGETLVGVKLGLTSEAKQRRMGVYAPFVAWLTDDMALRPGDPVPQHKLILWVPRTRSPHATCTYSWMRPPSRSRRSGRTAASEHGGAPLTGER